MSQSSSARGCGLVERLNGMALEYTAPPTTEDMGRRERADLLKKQIHDLEEDIRAKQNQKEVMVRDLYELEAELDREHDI